jgi:hypothetical protein
VDFLSCHCLSVAKHQYNEFGLPIHGANVEIGYPTAIQLSILLVIEQHGQAKCENGAMLQRSLSGTAGPLFVAWFNALRSTVCDRNLNMR